MVTGDGRPVSQVALTHPDLAGIHFTGSTATFQYLWRTVGENTMGDVTDLSNFMGALSEYFREEYFVPPTDYRYPHMG